MLYSIIPPALVVLSLVGIIVILVKKAPQVAKLEDEKFEERKIFSKRSSLPKDADSIGDDNKKKNAATLAVSEKMKNLAPAAKKMFIGFSSFATRMKNKKRNRNASRDLSEIESEIEETGKTEDEKYQKLFERRERDGKIEIKDEEIYIESEDVEAVPEEKPKKETAAKSSKKDLFEKILIDRIAANPKDIEAYERLGEYYLEIENWEYAKECFKQVLKLNPRNIGARSRMRKLERILGK